MTLPVFARAEAVVFLISGEDKAPILRNVFDPKGPSRRSSLPAHSGPRRAS